MSSGRSTNDGGIIIDVGRINQIEILDPATRRIRVGPGARWKQVATALAPYGWALTSGDYGGVGVGGLATAGGIGYLGREQGLDHRPPPGGRGGPWPTVRWSGPMTGRTRICSGPSAVPARTLGIVTSFEFEVDLVADAVGWAQLAFDASDTADFLAKFGAVAASAPRDTTAFLIMGGRRRGQPMVAQIMAVVDSADPEVIVERLQPFAQMAPMHSHQIVVMPYADVMNMFPDSDHQAQGEPVSRTAFVRHITPRVRRGHGLAAGLGGVYFFQIRTTGGATSDVDPDATAYAHRDVNFSVTAMGVDQDAAQPPVDGMRRHFDGLYLSFDTDLRPERVRDAFPPASLARLRQLKAQFDPDNVFRDNFNITPASTQAEEKEEEK